MKSDDEMENFLCAKLKNEPQSLTPLQGQSKSYAAGAKTRNWMAKSSPLTIIALAFCVVTATSCGKAQEKLFELSVVPDQVIVIPGKTWNCTSDPTKAADVDGPYFVLGFNLKNISKKTLRFHYMKLIVRSSSLSAPLTITYTSSAGARSSTLAPEATLIVRPPGSTTPSAVCMDPVSSIKFANPKNGASLSLNLKLYFTIESTEGEVQEPYQQEADATAIYYGD